MAQGRETKGILQAHVPWPDHAAIVEIPDAKLVHQAPARDHPDNEAIPFWEADSQLAQTESDVGTADQPSQSSND